MPSVWVPDYQTRDDRELVRRRLAVAEDKAKTQTRIRWLLKSNGVESCPAKPWTTGYGRWLEELAGGGLPPGAAAALGSLVRQWRWLAGEIERLDAQVLALSATARYAPLVSALCRRKGVGVLTAMVFLAEMGDLRRFANRQQVGSYLGLVPSSFETGEGADRKSHITGQGPSRVRKVLCQAQWSRLGSDPVERAVYERLVAKNPKHKKIALVARMRVLAVTLWHDGLKAMESSRAA
jgi:transposase